MATNSVYKCTKTGGIYTAVDVIASVTENGSNKVEISDVRTAFATCILSIGSVQDDNHFSSTNSLADCEYVPNDHVWIRCIQGLSGSMDGFADGYIV